MKLGDLNIAQKIILGIGTIAFAVRCFTYEQSRYFNASVVFHCLAIIAITAFLLLLFRRKEENAQQEQEEIERSPRKKPKVKCFLIAGSVLLLLVIGVILIIQYREGKNAKTLTQDEIDKILKQYPTYTLTKQYSTLTEEKRQKAYDEGLTPLDLILWLRNNRKDVEEKYDSWLTQGMDASRMLDEIIKMDTQRQHLLAVAGTKLKQAGITPRDESIVPLPASSVELFDMRLRGTGGHNAFSGRVQNRSAWVIMEIKLSITLYNWDGKVIGKPIDSGTATISCSIPPSAVRSVTGNVTEMIPSESWTWNYQILSVNSRRGQLESK